MINQQAPQPRVTGAADIAVHSIFYTMQGEGPHAGRPAVFVRLWGCNLQCPMCDTDYTSTRANMEPQQVVDRVDALYRAPDGPEYVAPLVVLTGGEPLRQPIGPLLLALVDGGYRVQIETNGTLPPPDLGWMYGSRVQYVVSPKTGTVHPKMAEAAMAYKYVITAGQVDPETGLPTSALDHPAHPQLPGPPASLHPSRVYVQPADPDPEGDNLAACLNAVLEHGHTLCLQQHKIVNLP